MGLFDFSGKTWEFVDCNTLASFINKENTKVHSTLTIVVRRRMRPHWPLKEVQVHFHLIYELEFESKDEKHYLDLTKKQI